MPDEIVIELGVGERFLGEVRKRAGESPSEVVLVVPRPGGKVLLHTKSFYPPDIYRLPSGKIHPGEEAEAAFAREFHEELGMQGHIDRNLGTIRCRLVSGDDSMDHVSHVYLARETCEEPRPGDEGEQITAFKEVAITELPAVAKSLRALPVDWRDWGRFRAIAHEFAAEALGVRSGE